MTTTPENKDRGDLPVGVRADPTDENWIERRLEQLGQRFEGVAERWETATEKADAVIWAAMATNAALAAVPVVIDLWVFMGVLSVMVMVLGRIYGYRYTRGDAAELNKVILKAVTSYGAVIGYGVPYIAAKVLQFGGITSVPGLALQGVLDAAVTYALGFTAKAYLANGCTLSEGQLRAEFKRNLKDGKAAARTIGKKRTAAAAIEGLDWVAEVGSISKSTSQLDAPSPQ